MNTKNIILSIIAIAVIIIGVKFFMNQQSPSRSEIKFTGNYISYELGSGMINSQKVTILDFYAPWCPSCRSTSRNIYTQASQIPENLQILNLDYDSNQGLRQKYGVTSQHTFVLIDNKGSLIDKTQSISSVSDLIKLAKPLLDKIQIKPTTTIQETAQVQTDQESKVQQENKPEELKNQGTGKIVENNEVPKQAIQPGKYIPYSEGLSSISQSDIETMLFFNASWCPSCRSVDKNIKSNIDKISNNLQILNIDYDSNQELRQKYGVTSQHTFVLIDNKGNEMKKIIGLDTIEDINNFIQ